MKLAKVAVITGGSEGFGLELAKGFSKKGYNLVLAARSHNKLEKAHKLLSSNVNSEIVCVTADVSKEEDNNLIISTALEKFKRIDVFIANAAVHGPKGNIESIDWKEWCEAIDINLKGVILGCRSVLPYFKSVNYGKIIVLSGGGATKPRPFFSAYAVSKAGIVRFVENLSEEIKNFKIDINCIAPGAMNTRLLDDIINSGPGLVGNDAYNEALKQLKEGGTDMQIGVNLALYLASEQANGISGKLISAVWDNWRALHENLDKLINSDIYTLRRVLPEERNCNW